MGDTQLSKKQSILALSLSLFSLWLFFLFDSVKTGSIFELWAGLHSLPEHRAIHDLTHNDPDRGSVHFMGAISNQEPSKWFWIETQFQLCWDLPPSCLEIILYFKTWLTLKGTVTSFWDVNELSRVELNWVFILLSLAWSQIRLRQAKLSSTVLN